MSKQSYSDIQAQIEKLRQEAEVVRQQEVAGVIGRIKEAISLYDLSAEDLFGRQKRSAQAKSTVRSNGAGTPKYRNAEGEVWGGRGPRPKWLRDALAQGKSLEDFLA